MIVVADLDVIVVADLDVIVVADPDVMVADPYVTFADLHSTVVANRGENVSANQDYS